MRVAVGTNYQGPACPHADGPPGPAAETDRARSGT